MLFWGFFSMEEQYMDLVIFFSSLSDQFKLFKSLLRFQKEPETSERKETSAAHLLSPRPVKTRALMLLFSHGTTASHYLNPESNICQIIALTCPAHRLLTRQLGPSHFKCGLGFLLFKPESIYQTGIINALVNIKMNFIVAHSCCVVMFCFYLSCSSTMLPYPNCSFLACPYPVQQIIPISAQISYIIH